MLQDSMGLRIGGDLPRGFETRDCGLPDFGFTPTVDSSGDGETFSSYTPSSSGASYDGSCSSNINNNDINYNFISDTSLSSYLMDGNVRAMLKKVTVNEGALNQAIQSLGGGEKGLKELMGYIMSWVQEHQHENSDYLSLSQSLPSLHSNSNNKSYPTVFGYGQHEEPNHLYQPCTKSRRLGDRSDVYRGVGALNGGLHEEFQYPKFEMAMQHPQQQQPVNGVFSFASGPYDLNRPERDDLSRTLAATTTRAARRNRIARQRQQSLPRNSSTPAAWSVAPPTLSMGTFHPQPAVVPGRKANNAQMLTFLLQKELRPSDVGNLGRIILPKKEAEMHLPILALREGVLLLMEDFDTGYCWNIRYRFWPNNKSRMYLLENTGEFVKQHQLQEGDLLILYRNLQGNYVLRGKKKVLSESRGGAQQKNAHSLARGFPEASKTAKVLKERDYGVKIGFGLESQEQSCQKAQCKDNNRVAVEMGPQAVKAETIVLVGDDDPFFKEDVMHNIGSSFGPELLQPLERFPSLNLDFPLDEIMAGIPKDDSENESSKMVPKAEPAE